MRPRNPPRRLQLARRAIAEEETYVAYHVVRTRDREHPDFLTSFRSRIALGLPPRTWTQEGANPEIADGISAYMTGEAAQETARAANARGRGFGEYVAEMRLTGNSGIEIVEWGANGHLTIWGDPLILSQTVTDIYFYTVD